MKASYQILRRLNTSETVDKDVLILKVSIRADEKPTSDEIAATIGAQFAPAMAEYEKERG